MKPVPFIYHRLPKTDISIDYYFLKVKEYLKRPDRNPATAPILHKPSGMIETPNALNPSFIQSPINVSEHSHPTAIPTNVASTVFMKRVTVKRAKVTAQYPMISAQL